MFKSLEYWTVKNNEGFNESFNLFDNDFQENFILNDQEHMYDKIISIYEKRNLNPAINLVLYFKSFEGTHTIEWLTSNFSKGKSKLYLKYKEEIEKYLLLI